MAYPAFTFNRILHYMSVECAFSGCFRSFDSLNDEFLTLLICLYTTPWIYLILGMYFYEVIPQKYGVRKHFFFCFNKCMRRCRKPKKTYEIELNINDTEVLSEITKVNQAKNERENYPLIVEKLTKVNNILSVDL
jgi:hypothetical protein